MRRNTAAISRRLEGEARKRDEHDDPSTMTDDALTASIYRLQARRWDALLPRIRELVAEKQRRLVSP